MNKPMPAASTARPHDAPLVPLSRGSAGEKAGGGKAREGRKREGAMEGERQTGRKGKDEGIPPWSQPCRELRALSSPHPSSSRSLPWDVEPAKPQVSPREALTSPPDADLTLPGE